MLEGFDQSEDDEEEENEENCNELTTQVEKNIKKSSKYLQNKVYPENSQMGKNFVSQSIENNLNSIYEDFEENNSQENLNKIEEDYKDNHCQEALWFLAKENCFRLKCYRLIKYPKFDTFILVMIIISSIKLAIDTYINDVNSIPYTISKNFDFFFTAIFFLEALIKTLALGFIWDEGTYLRETWSQLDFLIVCLSLVDVLLDGADFDFIKILRLVRILRPLRFISHNDNMKIMVNALLQSFGAIVNVVIVIIMIW